MAAIKRSLNVAVVGMGRMGIPIARNLAFKSRTSIYLQIHSRSLEKARKVCDDIALDGAQCAMRLHNKYSTVTKWSDVIIACLADREACRDAMFNFEDSLVRNARAGQIIVDHTTVDSETSQHLEYEAKKRGAVYLDAPLSGSSQAAYNGQLTAMVGGDEASFLKVLPLLRFYAENVHRMGESGSGSAAKMITQVLVAIHTIAAAEAMTLAHHLGVENYGKLCSVLDSSWGSSTMLRRNAPAMEKLIRNPERSADKTASSIDNLLKDLSQVPGSKDALKSLPLAKSSVEILKATSRAGVGDRDLSSVIHFLEAVGERFPDQVAPSPSSPSSQIDDEPEVEFY